jgi:hypothetical protein
MKQCMLLPTQPAAHSHDAHGHSHGAGGCDSSDHSHDHANPALAGGYVADQYNFMSPYVQQAYATAPAASPLPPPAHSHARMFSSGLGTRLAYCTRTGGHFRYMH